VDWEILASLLRQTRAGPDTILGAYHSHPIGGGDPSERDAEACWPGWSCLILIPRPDGESDLQSWRCLSGCGLVPERVVTPPGGRISASAMGSRSTPRHHPPHG
jgi:proteasome lid subunit RPN8/RPN11